MISLIGIFSLIVFLIYAERRGLAWQAEQKNLTNAFWAFAAGLFTSGMLLAVTDRDAIKFWVFLTAVAKVIGLAIFFHSVLAVLKKRAETNATGTNATE